MALNPLDLLREQVTPELINHADHQASSKAALLDQFYPILLAIFSNDPERFQHALDTGQNHLSALTGLQANHLQGLLEEFSRHHSLPVGTIEPLLNSAIPLSAQVLKNEVGNDNIHDYLGKYLPVIANSIPAWSAGFLTSLGLGNILASEPVSQHVYVKPAEKTGGFFSKFLPWLALLILLLLLLLFWRSCHHQEQTAPVTTNAPAPVVTPVQQSTSPAILALTSGEGNALLACNTSVGNADLSTAITTAVSSVFGTQKTCHATVDTAYSTTLPGQDKLQEILEWVKAIPNASLQWEGNQVIVNAPHPDDVKKLVDQIKAAAPELTVTAAEPLNVDQSVDNSINAAKSALTGLNDQAQPGDVARALNLQIINFASDSAEIPEKNKAVLDQAAAIIQKVPNVSLTVEGYTDSTGNAAHNKTLSEQRAQSVVDYLVGKGVDASKLKSAGYGQDNPVADNVTEQGKFRNRRIEFEVTNTQTGNTQQVDENTAQTSTAEQNGPTSQDTTVIATGSGSAPSTQP